LGILNWGNSSATFSFVKRVGGSDNISEVEGVGDLLDIEFFMGYENNS